MEEKVCKIQTDFMEIKRKFNDGDEVCFFVERFEDKLDPMSKIIKEEWTGIIENGIDLGVYSVKYLNKSINIMESRIFQETQLFKK